MAIVISDLKPEFNLFIDSESYLDELNDDELRGLMGGATIGAYFLTAAVIFLAGAAAGALAHRIAH
ncbi:MAG: hypothetical protein K6T90_17740 [Leptolyngbyaceae cyanobacterium HOT.MB2.61]|jgi:hypothetical protein|nr:hypothetical protein [Leptolyngbyaceae cyanobacterium HOT.MB2.61]